MPDRCHRLFDWEAGMQSNNQIPSAIMRQRTVLHERRGIRPSLLQQRHVPGAAQGELRQWLQWQLMRATQILGNKLRIWPGVLWRQLRRRPLLRILILSIVPSLHRHGRNLCRDCGQ
jgi:hypothetical protein